MQEFDYVAPSTVEEASRLLFEERSAIPLAGGTEIVVSLSNGKIDPSLLVDLRRLSGLTAITEAEEWVEIGTLVSMSSIIESALLSSLYPALAMAAGQMGCWQVRNLATLGGNLCNASPSADTFPPLLLYGAQLATQGPDGPRLLAFEKFLTGPGATSLFPGEILVSVRLPRPLPGLKSTYVRRQIRRSMDIPLVNLAVGVVREGEDNSVTEARICLGAVAPVPYRAEEAEVALLGRPLNPETIERAAALASESARAITDIRSSASYRTEMIRVFVRRALEALG